MSSCSGRPSSLLPANVCKLVTKYFKCRNVVEKSVKALPSYDDRNYYFRAEQCDTKCSEFVLKLVNPEHTPLPVAKEINRLMHHIHSKGYTFSTPYPVASTNGMDFVQLTTGEIINGENSLKSSIEIKDDEDIKYHMWLLTFISGELFDSVEKKYLTPSLLTEIGKALATLDKDLQETFFSAGLSDSNIWNLMNFLNSRKFLGDVEDPVKRAKAETVYDNFEKFIIPKLPSLKKSVIHGDFNGMNVILRKNSASNTYHLAGAIDFGDACSSCTIFDLGISVAYIMLENMNPVNCSDAIEFVGPMIGAYHRVLPLSRAEFDILYHIVLARAVQSSVLGAHSFKAEPWNAYILVTYEKAWILIDMLLSTEKEKVDRIWQNHVKMA